MVLIWTMTVSFEAPERIPSAPAMACSTLSSVGRMVKTTRALLATSAADRAPRPPRATSACTFSATTSWPTIG